MRKIAFSFLTLILSFGCLQKSLSQHAKPGGSQARSLSGPSATIPELWHQFRIASSETRKADLLYELANSYLLNLKIDSSFFCSQQLRKISLEHKYILGLGKYHLASGGACFLRNRGDEALNHADTAITIFESHGSDFYLGMCYRLKARQLGQQSDHKGAQNYFRNAIFFIRRSGDVSYLQRALHDFGRSFYFSFEVDSAAMYLTEALKLAEEMNNDAKIFNTGAMLGSVYLLSNELDAAGKTLKYALDMRPADVDKVHLRGVLANYAEVCILTDRYSEAEQVIREQEKINTVLGDITGQLNDKKLRGFLLYKQGRNGEAMQYLKAAYDLKEQLGKTDFDIITIALYLGVCELKEKMTRQAIAHFHHARQLSASYRFTAATMDANRQLADAFEQINNTDSAYHYYRAYAFIKDSIVINERDKTILDLSAKYNAEKKEFQIKELRKEKELQNKTIEAQQLLAEQRRQQIELVTQQAAVSRLRASEQSHALDNKNKEFSQKQRELEAAQKQNKLQQAVAAKESQNKKLLMVIVVAGLVTVCYVLYRYRQTEKMRKQLTISLSELRQTQQQLIQIEKQNEAHNIRQRISRDIHDEVGATLSGVVLFSEIARQKLGGTSNEDAGEYLDHIYSNSKDMLEKMSDIVWAINPKNDSFEKIIFKLKTYAMNLCAGKGIALHFNIEEALFQYSVSMQTRKNIYLLIKESINNAAKYSMANNIYLSMKRENDLMHIEVCDDGGGFEMNNQTVGNGIGNMQTRAKELGSELVIRSAPEKGTRITLQFEFHPIEVQAALHS